VSKKKAVKEAPERGGAIQNYEPVAELRALAEQVKSLYKKVEESETSAIELGTLLLEVKDYVKNRPGGLKRWIKYNIGEGPSTYNRCKYAQSLVDPKSTRGKKKAERDAATQLNWDELEDIRKEADLLVKATLRGDIQEAHMCRSIIMGAVEIMVKRTEYSFSKRSRQTYARELKNSGNPLGDKILVTELGNQEMLKREFGYGVLADRPQRPRRRRRFTPYEDSKGRWITNDDLDFTGRQQAEIAKAAAATAGK
jgi:hypothetical protein